MLLHRSSSAVLLPSLWSLSTRVRDVSARVSEPVRCADRTESGGRSSLCGLPCSFSQSKGSGKWRRCVKTWPGQQRGMEAGRNVDAGV